MAIRGPRPDQVLPQRREQPTSPEQRLMDVGSARTPAEAHKLLRDLLTTLRARGLPVAATGKPSAQLGAALKLFQQSQGLPASGQLDRATHEALVDQGALPRPKDAAVEPGAVAPK